MLRFTCTCGKVLKAPLKLAGKTSPCPACGFAVTVPLPERETLAQDRQREATAYGTSPSADSAIPAQEGSPPEGSPVLASRESQARRSDAMYALTPALDTAWVPSVPQPVGSRYDAPALFQKQAFEYGCDPLLGVWFVLRLAGMQALLTAVGVGLYPYVLSAGTAWANGLVLASIWIAATGAALGFGCRFLDSMLDYGLGGGTREPAQPDFDFGEAATSLVRWALCLACGPAVLLYCAFRYWLYSGDMTPLDGLILAELTVPAVGYGLFGLLVLRKHPERACPAPSQVLKACRRLGLRAVAAAMGMTLMVLVHVLVGIGGILLLRAAGLPGLLLLWLCWFSLWHSSAWALRTVGRWYYRRRKVSPAPIGAQASPVEPATT